jgi:hypothetical protein
MASVNPMYEGIGLIYAFNQIGPENAGDSPRIREAMALAFPDGPTAEQWELVRALLSGGSVLLGALASQLGADTTTVVDAMLNAKGTLDDGGDEQQDS